MFGGKRVEQAVASRVAARKVPISAAKRSSRYAAHKAGLARGAAQHSAALTRPAATNTGPGLVLHNIANSRAAGTKMNKVIGNTISNNQMGGSPHGHLPPPPSSRPPPPPSSRPTKSGRPFRQRRPPRPPRERRPPPPPGPKFHANRPPPPHGVQGDGFTMRDGKRPPPPRSNKPPPPGSVKGEGFTMYTEDASKSRARLQSMANRKRNTKIGAAVLGGSAAIGGIGHARELHKRNNAVTKVPGVPTGMYGR